MDIKVSVIIPVKNRANLLPVTLDNVLGQSLRPHEVIVVDDGSTDTLGNVIKAYQSSVIFTKNTGTGPGAARNTGLRISTGHYIQFFDSDDLMTKNKLEVQARLLHEKNADLVYGPWVKALQENGFWKQVDVIMQYFPVPASQLADYVLQGWCNITQSVLFRKELINETGYWREDLMTHEDYEFWFRIAKNVRTICHENKSCVVYRQHQHQITDKQVTDKARWMDSLKARSLIEEGIDYKASLYSLLLFKGGKALSQKQFDNKYNSHSNLGTSSFKNAAINLYRFHCKLGRLQTGTSWQKMHGVLKRSPDMFRHYITHLA